MKRYLEQQALLNVLQGYTIFIIFFLLVRVFFFFYFGGAQYFDTHSLDIFRAFILGLRYDLIVTSYLLAPVVIFLLLIFIFPLKWLYWLETLLVKISVLLGGVLFLAVEICDLSFYSFFQDHINILFYGLFEDDTSAVLESIWKDYPVVWIGLGIIVYLGVFVALALRWWSFHPPQRTLSVFKRMGLFLGVLCLYLGALRGGYGLMVLSPKYSDFSSVEFINHVSQNGVIALEKTYQLRKSRSSLNFNLADELGYKKRIQDAFSDYLGIDLSLTPRDELVSLLWRRTPLNKNLDKKKPHVVVVLMESFGSSWLEFHSEQFNLLGDLEGHLKEGLYTPYFLPADNGTIGSLMSLSMNIPHRKGARFLSESRYMDLQLDSAAHLPFKRRGYRTHFLYGGKLAWRNIGRYFKNQNYDEVEGENALRQSIRTDKVLGNEWGLFDEHLFRHALKKLSGDSPQFIFMLTTSNHPPFDIPTDYRLRSLVPPAKLEKRVNREKDLFRERFQAYQYANQKLAEFLSEIKENHPNTIVAVTGDHNFFGFVTYEKEEVFLKHAVPVFFHFPKEIRPKVAANTLSLGSHEDIMPTLYNHALSDTEYLSFGEDLFTSDTKIGINDAILADKSGVSYRGRAYPWGDFPLVSGGEIPLIKPLDRRYRSSVSVADFFLRFTREQKLVGAKRNQPKSSSP